MKASDHGTTGNSTIISMEIPEHTLSGGFSIYPHYPLAGAKKFLPAVFLGER